MKNITVLSLLAILALSTLPAAFAESHRDADNYRERAGRPEEAEHRNENWERKSEKTSHRIWHHSNHFNRRHRKQFERFEKQS